MGCPTGEDNRIGRKGTGETVRGYPVDRPIGLTARAGIAGRRKKEKTWGEMGRNEADVIPLRNAHGLTHGIVASMPVRPSTCLVGDLIPREVWSKTQAHSDTGTQAHRHAGKRQKEQWASAATRVAGMRQIDLHSRSSHDASSSFNLSHGLERSTRKIDSVSQQAVEGNEVRE